VLQQTAVKLRDPRIVSFFVVDERLGRRWSYRAHYKGEQTGVRGLGSFFLPQMSLWHLRHCMVWNVAKRCRKIMHVYLGLLERLLGKTS
jgi:hypothetical protein